MEQVYNHFKQVVLHQWQHATNRVPRRIKGYGNKTLDIGANALSRLYKKQEEQKTKKIENITEESIKL